MMSPLSSLVTSNRETISETNIPASFLITRRFFQLYWTSRDIRRAGRSKSIRRIVIWSFPMKTMFVLERDIWFETALRFLRLNLTEPTRWRSRGLRPHTRQSQKMDIDSRERFAMICRSVLASCTRSGTSRSCILEWWWAGSDLDLARAISPLESRSIADIGSMICGMGRARCTAPRKCTRMTGALGFP